MMDRFFTDWDRLASQVFTIRNAERDELDSLLSTIFYPRNRHLPANRERGKRVPRLHPTKGYRGAHKNFRGGSR